MPSPNITIPLIGLQNWVANQVKEDPILEKQILEKSKDIKMSSQLFKQFILKTILSKQGPPGPAPREGLKWKPQTHRWIRPKDGSLTPEQPPAPSDDDDDEEEKHFQSIVNPSPHQKKVNAEAKKVRKIIREDLFEAVISGKISLEGEILENINDYQKTQSGKESVIKRALDNANSNPLLGPGNNRDWYYLKFAADDVRDVLGGPDRSEHHLTIPSSWKPTSGTGMKKDKEGKWVSSGKPIWDFRPPGHPDHKNWTKSKK